MEEIATLLHHLERLDNQLTPTLPDLQQDHLKLVKEVLLAKHQLRHHLRVPPHAIADAECRQKLDKVYADQGYNIDRINAEYSGTVVCPYCRTDDVAVIKYIGPTMQSHDFHQGQNRRIKLVRRRGAATGGLFACNSCSCSFDPPLPSSVVKLCEMLYRYYY